MLPIATTLSESTWPHGVRVDLANKMNSIRFFLSGIVDYAGLFPPAGLNMATAVSNYARYRAGVDRDLLGRFVVPAARLDEFGDAVRGLLELGDASEPWRLSVVVGDNLVVARKAVVDFNSSHSPSSELGYAQCDAIEIHAHTEADVLAATQAFGKSFRVFFEIPFDSDPRDMLRVIARHSGSAKMRTGGLTEAAFPPSSAVIRFMSRCNDLGIRFKATAGLHHVLRAAYPLTYEADSPTGLMFGYLNLFFSAAFIRSGMSEAEACEVLEEQSAAAFSFSDGGIAWRGRTLTASELAATRAHALSFGSCSFRDPVDEARALQII
jgi:hypothetical protein